MVTQLINQALNHKMTLDEWRRKPWPPELGDCYIVNSWGHFVVIDGFKNGPYEATAIAAKNHPTFFERYRA